MPPSLFVNLIRTGCKIFSQGPKCHEFLAPVVMVVPNEAEYIATSTLPTTPRRIACMDMV